MKNQLVFDVTDAFTIIDSDSVGAFVRSSDGTLIDHLTVANAAGQFDGQVAGMTTDVVIDALVRGPAGNITLVADSVTDIDGLILAWNTANADNQVVLTSGDGSQIPTADIVLSGGDELERLAVDAAMKDGYGAPISSTNGALNSFITNSSIVVEADDLDIRDLDAAQDSVAAHLFDGSGNAISSTDGALDVNLKSPLVVDVDIDGVYESDDNPTPDSAGAIFHTRAASITIVEQVERTTAAAVAAVAAADISKINALDVNSFLYAVNDDSGDLELLSLSDENGGLNVNISGGEVEINDAALANTAIKSAANGLDVADTREAVVATALEDRKYLFIANVKNRMAYIGGADLTQANGYPIAPGAQAILRAGDAINVQWISANTDQEIRVLELS